MSTRCVEFDVSADGVATITLDGPHELNLYTLAMRDELIEAFEAAELHPDAGAVLLRATGKHFSAGADLTEFGTADDVFEARRARWDRDPWVRLWEVRHPTVAALHGIVMGSGLEMALLCDFRLTSDDALFALPETKLGMLPSAGGTQTLSRVIGPSAALAFILPGETIDAAEAMRLGIVDEVCTDVEGRSMALASALAALDRLSVRTAKEAVRLSADLPLLEGLAAERRLAFSLAARTDHT